MGNSQAKLYYTGIGRKKLGEYFQHIISNAKIDFTNPEIQDIQAAVYIMLERIRTRVNSRGIFDIARILSCGSMAEKTSLWKFNSCERYLEFDFLAILKQYIIQCEEQLTGCLGCIRIANFPVELERLRQCYNREEELNANTVKDKDVLSNLFLNEINHCVSSSCNCLSLQSDTDKFCTSYNISFRPSSEEHKHGCRECTVDMPTGTLRVNTEITIEQYRPGPNNCSLTFLWTSKTTGLLAPDMLLLQDPQPVSSLPIYVDFLPALESLKVTSSGCCCCIWRNSSGAGDVHDYFIVPKRCNVCGLNDDRHSWRKSWCLSELNTFTAEISDRHKRCYQVMKYLSQFEFVNNYHIKTIVLRHHKTCSDKTDECECVLKMFYDLLRAYKTRELLSHKSDLNMLEGGQHVDDIVSAKYRCKGLINKVRYMPLLDNWATFIERINDQEILSSSELPDSEEECLLPDYFE